MLAYALEATILKWFVGLRCEVTRVLEVRVLEIALFIVAVLR